MKNTLTLSVSICYFLLLPVLSTGQTDLRSSIRALAESEAMKGGIAGVSIIDLESGREIAGWEAEKSLIPASTLKAVTTATAFGLLGKDFRYETLLEYEGKLDESGTLKGNLYIRGSGDPTLGSPEMEGVTALDELFQRWEQAAMEAGIRRIEGDVITDISLFGTAVNCPGWQWADLGNYYAGGAWALNIHENLYYLHFQQQSRLGMTPPVHSLDPAVPGLELINEVRTAGAGTGDNAYIFGAPYQNRRFIRGTIPAGNMLFTIKGSLPNPPFFAAETLRTRLVSCGIPVKGQALVQTAPSSSERTVIHRHLSPSLLEIATRTNHESVNLYAEALLRTLGGQREGKTALEAGLERLFRYWEQKGLKKLDGFFPEDGSGLSARNGITARQLAQTLYFVHRDAEEFDGFEASLPVAGESGTLTHFLRGTSAAGKVRAKSGSMKRVRAYAGYLESRSGQRYAFALLANNFAGNSGDVKRKMEKILLALYGEG